MRRLCVQACADLLVHQGASLSGDIEEPLRQRQHDPDENVRMDVVQAIVAAAKRKLANVTDPLLQAVKERTLDKKVIYPLIPGLGNSLLLYRLL